jgi:hypothetical protein
MWIRDLKRIVHAGRLVGFAQLALGDLSPALVLHYDHPSCHHHHFGRVNDDYPRLVRFFLST